MTPNGPPSRSLGNTARLGAYMCVKKCVLTRAARGRILIGADGAFLG